VIVATGSYSMLKTNEHYTKHQQIPRSVIPKRYILVEKCRFVKSIRHFK